METGRLFITGMGGMEGRILAAVAVERGYKVSGSIYKKRPDDIIQLEAGGQISSYSVDLLDYDETRKVLLDAQPAIVIHLAGHVLDNPKLGIKVYEDNVTMLNQIHRAIGDLHNRPLLVFSSAALVYGRPETPDLVYECRPHELPCPNYSEPYRASKIVQEQNITNFNLNYMIGRPAQHTGPGRIPNVVESDIATGILFIKKGEADHIPVRNKIAEVDMLDARDVATAYLSMVENGQPQGIYNIASGTATNVEILAKTMLEIAGLPSDQYPVVSTSPEQPSYSRFSTDKLKTLGWKPQYSLKDALTSFWNDFIISSQRLTLGPGNTFKPI